MFRRHPGLVGIVIKIDLLPVFLRIPEQKVKHLPFQLRDRQHALIRLHDLSPQALIPVMFFHDLSEKIVQVLHLHTQVHLVEFRHCRITGSSGGRERLSGESGRKMSLSSA